MRGAGIAYQAPERKTSATSECPQVAALVFNIFFAGTIKHKAGATGSSPGGCGVRRAARVKKLAKGAAKAKGTATCVC
jgi:hypothetical protein